MTVTVLFLLVALALAVYSFTPHSSGKPALAAAVVIAIIGLLVASIR